jgi:hypothetical protein
MSAAEMIAIIAGSMAATAGLIACANALGDPDGNRGLPGAGLLGCALAAAALVSAVLLTETALGLARLLMS